MNELALIGIALLFAGLAALAVARPAALRSSRAAGAVAIGWGALSCLAVGVALANRHPPTPEPPEDRPIEVPDDEYLTSTSCRACHPDQFASWHRSYHRTMTQQVSAETVVADFDDASVAFVPGSYRMFEKDGTYYGEMDAPGWMRGRNQEGQQRVTVPLNLSTGSHHMQVFWYPTGANRSLALFPLAWLIDEERWIPRQSGFIDPPGPVANTFSLWNRICLDCHSTESRPRLRDKGPDTHVAEFGITCEACHGPGGGHADANTSPVRRYSLYLSDDEDETIVEPTALPHQRDSQVCGQCHAARTVFDQAHMMAWNENGTDFLPGDDLEAKVNMIAYDNLDDPTIQLMLEQNPGILRMMFWSDGLMRISGREFSPLRESACYTRGEISCMSCHQMHKAVDDPRSLDDWADDQLAPGMREDAACTSCHPQYTTSEQIEAHTHHPMASEGSRCQNCHMSYNNYGLLKAIRNHRIDIPKVREEIETSRPNACNQCHFDKTLAFTNDALQRWYGTEPPLLTGDQREVAAGVRWVLKGDAGVRALAAWTMGWAPAREASGRDWMAPYLFNLLEDPYDAVRVVARRTFERLPEFEGMEYDELASQSRRGVAMAKIRAQWASRTANAGTSGGRTFATGYDASGALRIDRWERLLAERDNRPLILLE